MNATHDDDGHVDLLGLLTGELSVAERVAAVDHLHGCPTCPTAFLDMAISVGLMRDAARHGPVDPSEVPPLRLDLSAQPPPPPVVRAPDPRPPRARRAMASALIVVALIAALAGGVAIGRSGRPAPAAAAAGVTLTAVGAVPTAAQGEARMLGAGAAQHMNVTVTGLMSLTASEHYEVWLLDTRSGHVLAVGAITGGSSTFALPVSRTAGFDAIDISLQTPADGSRHSGHSVLRGTIA